MTQHTNAGIDYDGIRPCGPGKFNTVLDSYVYDVSLGGCCDDEISSEYDRTYHCLMRNGRSIFVDHDPMLESLTAAEQEQLTSSAGVILTETGDGSVYVEYFDTMAELDAAWGTLQAENENIDDDDDSEE